MKMKTSASSSSSQNLFVAIVLTPLFLGNGLDLSKTKVEQELEFLNRDNLVRTHCLKGRDVYAFLGRDGITYFCKLPNKHSTSLISAGNLEFTPAEEYLIHDPSGGSCWTMQVRKSSAYS